MRALDAVKKDIQERLKGTAYNLFGVISYELADGELAKLEEVVEHIGYFEALARDKLFVNLVIILSGNTYDAIVKAAAKTDEILNSHKVVDLDTNPHMAVDIQDAKRRWNSAVADCSRDGQRVSQFIFYRNVSAVPYAAFTDARESLPKELKALYSDAVIEITITTDSYQSARYDCYVGSTAS